MGESCGAKHQCIIGQISIFEPLFFIKSRVNVAEKFVIRHVLLTLVMRHVLLTLAQLHSNY